MTVDSVDPSDLAGNVFLRVEAAARNVLVTFDGDLTRPLYFREGSEGAVEVQASAWLDDGFMLYCTFACGGLLGTSMHSVRFEWRPSEGADSRRHRCGSLHDTFASALMACDALARRATHAWRCCCCSSMQAPTATLISQPNPPNCRCLGLQAAAVGAEGDALELTVPGVEVDDYESGERRAATVGEFINYFRHIYTGGDSPAGPPAAVSHALTFDAPTGPRVAVDCSCAGAPTSWLAGWPAGCGACSRGLPALHV